MVCRGAVGLAPVGCVGRCTAPAAEYSPVAFAKVAAADLENAQELERDRLIDSALRLTTFDQTVHGLMKYGGDESHSSAAATPRV
jgi:hypothetical protein